MSEMRDILSLLDEDIQVEDSFDIELSEDLVIETGVIGLTEDAVIIEADEETLGLLEASGITLDEGDIIKGPWNNNPMPNPAMPAQIPSNVVPIQRPASSAASFKIQDLFREFKNSPQVRQKLLAIAKTSLPDVSKDDEFMNMAASYLESKLGKVHPKLLGKYAIAFLDMYKSSDQAKEMKEDDLDEIVNLAGIPMVGGKTPQEIERLANVPTVQRIKSGETPPVDRTDYNVPPGQRTSTAGMTGPEIRRQSLIKQGIIKAEGEEDIEESGLQAYLGKKKYGEKGMKALQKAGRDGASKEKMAQLRAKYDKLDEGPADEPVEPDMDADDKRFDDIDEAKYQGREVPLGKPMAGDVKKSKVYVRKPNGKVVKVNFGDKNMRIKKSNPGRRKNFRARHNCQNPGPRWKARYWSCRAW